MSRLNYTVNYSNETEHTVPELRLNIKSNYLGTPQARIYLTAEAAPAFENMTLGGSGVYFLNKSDIPLGDYTIEYKDDNGEVLIANVKLISLAETCYAQDGPLAYDEKGAIGWFSVSDANFVFGHGITHSGGTGSEDRSRRVSLDGGVTFHNIGSNLTFATWYNDELEEIGAANTIPSITNVRNSNGCTEIQATNIRVGDPVFEPMEVTATKTNCTADGADDGTIVLTITGGSGNRTYAWTDGPVTQNRANLAPGVYSVTVTDNTTDEIVTIEGIEITEPAPEPLPSGTIFEFPPLNDLQVVVDPIDPAIDVQTLDNTLFADQVFQGFEKSCYFQKVVQSDQRILQFNSDFPFHTAILYNYLTDAVVKNLAVILKEQNIGVVDDYAVQIKNHPNNPGKSRVYFTVGAFPLPLAVGENVEILNNAEGFNGNYTILEILNDTTLGYQYFVINLNYTGAGSVSDSTARFLTSVEEYNTYEVPVLFNDVAVGKYYIKVFALNDDDTGREAETEPIHLKAVWPGTHLIEYRNVDNGYGDITWTTGYIGRIRVESLFGHKRLPSGGERGVSRNADYAAVKTFAKKVRGLLFETFLLTPYLHEKLGLAFDCDSWSIDGVPHQSVEPYADPTYMDKILLANSSIRVEQVGWIKGYNSHDIGTVAEEDLLEVNSGFLKVK